MQKWTVQRSFSGGALWSGNCDRSLSLLLSHFFGGNIVLNVLQPCVKIAIWKIKCAFSWKPLYRGGGLKDAFSSRDGQLCVFKPLEKSLTAKPVSCWSFDRNQKVSAISFSLSPCQLPFSWSVGQVITALDPPHRIYFGRKFLSVQQTTITDNGKAFGLHILKAGVRSTGDMHCCIFVKYAKFTIELLF